MKKSFIYILTLITAVTLDLTAGKIHTAHAQSDGNTSDSLLQDIEAIISDPALSRAAVGICVQTADGRTIVDIDASRMLVPASNMKLISTGAALDALGSGFRFRTQIGCDGEIRDGVLYGNIHIIGGGDPTLGSRDSIAVQTESTFAQWERIVRDAGIRRIEGCVIGDGRHFEGMAEEPTWLWNDIGTYYGAGTTGLMFYENTQSFSVSAGPETGAPVNITPSYPEAPWMEFRYACTTGEKGTGDLLYMYTSDLAPIAEIRGSFGVDRAPKRVDCANKFPEYTCAWYFSQWLDRHGIRCTGGAADYRLYPDRITDYDETAVIGSTLSPTLDRIVFETNHQSNNLYAETLLRTLGKEICGNACYDSAYVAAEAALKSLGADPQHGLNIQDGSGLSRRNYVSPEFFCDFLRAMMSSDCFDDYLKSLPHPGGTGTLQYNMKSYPAALRNRIRAKSGSMNGIRCYSGYILPADCPTGSAEGLSEDIRSRTVVFSVMVNNCTAPNWKVRPLLDKIMGTLAGSL